MESDAAHQPKSRRGIRVLILDDDPFLLKLVGRQLAHIGFQNVVTCESASEALSLIADRNADPVELVISDIYMPKTDGIEFVRRLVTCHYTGDLLLMSGKDQHILRAAASLAQAHGLNLLGYLVKPFEFHELQRLIDPAGQPDPISSTTGQ